MDLYKAVLLDIDGTIFSSEDIIGDTYKEGFHSYGERTGKIREIPEHEMIMKQIGKPIVEIFQNLAPELTPEEQLEVSEEILNRLVENINAGRGSYYEGAIDTIRALHDRGYRLFGASNGRFPYIEAILKHAGVFDLFEAVPVVNNTTIKNKIELVTHILDSASLMPQEAVMVGDRYSDRDAGIKNNVSFAACRFGHGTPEEWEGASFFIDSIGELLDHLPEIPAHERIAIN